MNKKVKFNGDLKSYLLFLFSLFCLNNYILGTTWKSTNQGYWNNSATWQGGLVPPISSSDTFVIRHALIIENNLILNNQAYFFIDSTGGICGHQKIIINTGAKITKYGILELDTLEVQGGVVNCFAPGAVVLTHYGLICCGGVLQNIGNPLSVGPWFNCNAPQYTFAYIGINEESESSPTSMIFPNPFSDFAMLIISERIPLNQVSFIMLDVMGIVITRITNITEHKVKLESDKLKNGIYFYVLKNNQEQISKGKFCKY